MSMENGLGNDLIEALMDDFYAESDEHLEAIRTDLLRVEKDAAAGAADASLVEDLFRRFHTLKGLAGMVGLGPAEIAAHTIETFLRTLREEKSPVSEGAMDDLMEGVKLIEQAIAARKAGAPLPQITTWERRMAGRRGDPPGKPKEPSPVIEAVTSAPAREVTFSLPEEVQKEMNQAVSEGAVLYQFGFTPSKELADRGVNVNLVRERFETIGRLLHAVPRVQEKGGVSFEFLVAATSDVSSFAAWKADGLTWEPYGTGPREAPSESEREAPPGQAAAAPTAASTVVRVDIGRVDDLMRMVGELVISRARMEDAIRRVQPDLGKTRIRPLHETDQRMERQLRDLREGVMRLRMVPIAEIFNRMQFVVRDLGREARQEIHLTLEGQETELDKFVVERMMDPLLHLVRNAVSHGLESREERVRKGKPAAGTISLKAATSGDQVLISVGDDGRGLDREKILERAQAQGRIPQGEGLTEEGLLDVLCVQGFSTKEDADRASGRGVGMAVVQETVRELGGSLSVASRPEAGTLFTITLPLTLAITDAFIILAGGQRFAVPQGLVREVIEFRPEDRVATQATEMILYRNSALPLVRLARVFGLPEGAAKKLYALIFGMGRSSIGVVIDRVVARREIVVRSVTDPLIHVPGISGATELGDGKVVLILDGTVGGMTVKK